MAVCLRPDLRPRISDHDPVPAEPTGTVDQGHDELERDKLGPERDKQQRFLEQLRDRVWELAFTDAESAGDADWGIRESESAESEPSAAAVSRSAREGSHSRDRRTPKTRASSSDEALFAFPKTCADNPVQP